MFRAILLSSLTALVAAQSFNDFEMKCKDGERVSAIYRKQGKRDMVGEMKVKCVPMKPKPATVECQYSARPFACQAKEEPCEEDEWLAGLKGYSMDSRTGALLLHPYCCSSEEVEVSDCEKKMLVDRVRKKISAKIKKDEVFQGFQCEATFDDRRGYLWDFSLTAQKCKYKVTPSGAGGEDEGEGEEKPKKTKWKKIKDTTMYHKNSKKLKKIGKKPSKNLKACRSLCKENEKCGTLAFDGKKKTCFMYKVKPVNGCKTYTKKSKGWTIMYKGGDKPKGKKCF